MFSGIIQTVVPVHNIYEENNIRIYTVSFPQDLLKTVKIGSSISNNGCCLTVNAIKYNLISFNLIYATLKITNMNMLKPGDLINIEESICYHDKIGGHLLTGHIDSIGSIKKIINLKKNTVLWIKLKNSYYQQYIIPRGSIGIEGVSLTINKIVNDHIRICLTPYTIHNTTLGTKKIGDVVNIEIDLLIKTIIHTIEKKLPNIINEVKVK